MTVAEVRKLFAYDAWGNARLFRALGGLSEEQVRTVAPSSFSSLQATIAHIVAAEWIWLRRWLGESPTSAPAWAADGSLEKLREALAEVEAERATFLAGLTDARLREPIQYRNLSGEDHRNELGDLLRHLVNHSTYHRGQAATQLRQLGVTPPGTDLIVYLREVG